MAMTHEVSWNERKFALVLKLVTFLYIFLLDVKGVHHMKVMILD